MLPTEAAVNATPSAVVNLTSDAATVGFLTNASTRYSVVTSPVHVARFRTVTSYEFAHPTFLPLFNDPVL